MLEVDHEVVGALDRPVDIIGAEHLAAQRQAAVEHLAVVIVACGPCVYSLLFV